MSADAVDELAELRRRAYGPGADITADAAAVARLRELEARAAGRETAPARRGPDAPPPPGPAEPVARAEPARAEPVAQPAHTRPAPAEEPRPLSRRIRVAWAGSLVAAVALAAGVTAWVFPLGARDAAQHAALLSPTPGPVPSSLPFGGDTDPRYFGEYRGLHVYVTSQCLYATGEGEGASFYGAGCVGQGLEPVMEVYVPSPAGAAVRSDVAYPEELTSGFPDGAVIRFARQGETVLVDVGALPAMYG